MTDKTRQLVKKSHRSLKAGMLLFKEGHYDFCVSRTFFAMFCMVEALFLTRHLATAHYNTLLKLFHQHYIQTGVFEKERHEDLYLAYVLAHQGDHWSENRVYADTATDLLKKAELFLRVVEKYIQKITQE